VPDGGRGRGAALRGAVGAALLLAVVAATLLIILSSGVDDPERITAPAAPEVAVPEPTPTPVPDGAGPIGSSLLDEDPGDREPTDADAAAFGAGYEAPVDTPVELVTADLDGDGRPEVVAAFVAGGLVRVEVAAWDGGAYQVVFAGPGGPAEELLAFEVRDVTGDGGREILTRQVGRDRESLALWGATEEGFAPLAVRGGCWDGSHVVGVDGADAADGRLSATCPRDAEAGLARRGRDLYTWDGQVWTYERTEET
jgi:hypothetical protein